MFSVINDLRYSFRTLRNAPVSTITAILALALGIGANTAIFSLVEGALLRPLPYKDSDRMVMVWETEPELQRAPLVGPDYLDWKKDNRVFDQMVAGTEAMMNLTGSGEPLRLQGFQVSPEFFNFLGVTPELGRSFLPGEDQQGKDHVVVLSYGLWQRAFAGDRDVIGKQITLDSQTYDVVGVTPASFQFLPIWDEKAEFWIPLEFYSQPWKMQHGNHWLWAMARLKPGVSLNEARASLQTIAARLSQQYEQNQGVGANIEPVRDYLTGNRHDFFILLLCAVGFVLAIACANVTNLLLVKARQRRRAVAVCLALGASRARVARALLVESWTLAFLGGAAGVLVAVWLKELILKLSPEGYIRAVNPITIDARVLAFTFVISLLTGTIFGLAPAWQSARTNLQDALKEGTRTVTGGRRGIQQALVVVEIGAALALLVGAGLTVRSLVNLLGVDMGFNPRNVLAAHVSLPGQRYPDATKITAFFENTLQEVRAVPGITAVAATSELPVQGGHNGTIRIEGQPVVAGFKSPLVEKTIVTPDYFSVMQIPMLRGRNFSPADSEKGRLVAIINSAMARRFWPNQDPIGRRFSQGDDKHWTEVVGIVGDVRQWSLAAPPMPQAFFPLGQGYASSAMSVVVRSEGDPLNHIAPVTAAIHRVDKELPVYGITSMQQILFQSAAMPRFDAVLFGLFSVVALLLASIGIYGVMSYFVTQRTHELGIRMALGADRRDMFAMLLADTMKLSLLGLGLGGLLVVFGARLLRNLVFGITVTDPSTIITVSMLLLLVALFAGYWPARRATRIDPLIALRYE